MTARVTALVAGLTALVVAAPLTMSRLAAQVPTPPSRVTAVPEKTGPGLVSRVMATIDALSFAVALAEAGHTAGFVMPTSERQGMVPPDSGEKLTLEEAVEVFTARGTYRVSRHGEVLVFQHVKAPADIIQALNARRQLSASKQPFSATLFDTVLRSLAMRPVARGGPASAEPGAGPDCQVDRSVTVAAGPATTIDTLNRLVRQTKGVGWMVRYGASRENLRLQIGYVCGNGVWSALSVPGW